MKLRGLWDELNTTFVGPTCTCGALPKFLEEHKFFQFLSGLNEPYSTCKSNILMMTPFFSLSKAYSMLHHNEKQKEHSIPSNFTTDSMSCHVSSRKTEGTLYYFCKLACKVSKHIISKEYHHMHCYLAIC